MACACYPLRCHPAHKFSRRKQRQNYRNLIVAMVELGADRLRSPALTKFLYLGVPPRLVFKWRFDHLARCGSRIVAAP
jgi:hypothetical protein